MNDTAVVATDLDRLAERVERAAALITELRSKNTQWESKHTQLEAKHTQLEQEHASLLKLQEDTHGKLQGQDPTALVAEVAALKKEQRDWLNERKDVATRIEAISAKLERLE